MPELPEVETVKKVLIPIVKDRTIIAIDVNRSKTILGDSGEFVASLKGEKFLDVTRIGKFLIFHLTHNKVFISHLRMEGKYYDYDEKESDSKYARVVFHLDNHRKLCYDDSRSFGIMKLTNEENYLKEKEIAKLGPEPFDIKDVSTLYKKCQKKNLPIKSTLLDQSVMTGLGNIYVDEVLYASQIHPLTPAYKITLEQWKNIVKNSVDVLNKSIQSGGSTIKSYHPGKDIDGNFQVQLLAYGKAGETCPKCHHTFRFIKVNGRGTTFCPNCQKKVGAPLHIALTGKLASGKSTILDFFAKHKVLTLSSDEVVAKLYQKEEVTAQLEKILKIKFPSSKVDKNVLREHLFLHPEDKKKVERYIHPLVKKEIISFLKSPERIKVVEVPLLFESKLDPLFDTIIVSDISYDKQMELLKKREGNHSLYLEKINSTNKIDLNKYKATYIIENNGDKKALVSKCQDIFNKLLKSLD